MARILFVSKEGVEPQYYGEFDAEQIRVATQLVKDLEREDKLNATVDSLFDGVKIGE